MEIKAFKPTDRDQKLFDGGGLYWLIKPSGTKLWKMKFRANGLEKKLSLGAIPTVCLKDARQKRDEAKRALDGGQDPARQKQDRKLAAKAQATNTFNAVADEYIEKMTK